MFQKGKYSGRPPTPKDQDQLKSRFKQKGSPKASTERKSWEFFSSPLAHIGEGVSYSSKASGKMKKYCGICRKYEGTCRKYEGNMKKYEEKMKKYEGNMTKYIGRRT